MPDATSFPTAPLDLVLHIGTGKTGTSTIQYFLHRNRERLAELGVLYPKTPGRLRHTKFGLFFQPDHRLGEIPSWERQGTLTPEEFRSGFRRRLSREIKRSGASRVLFSDEALYGSPDQALANLGRFRDQLGRSVRVVVYLRRQDDHVVSRYQQVVKVGETRRLVQRMREMDLSRTYDYYTRLSEWQRVARPDAMVVRRFERSSFAGGSLLQDFLDAAGIDARAEDLEPVERRNESLDVEAVEFLRILNLCREEHPELAGVVPQNRPLVLRLAEVSSGPTVTMPAARLDDFMATWEESNRRVAASFLGDESGVLFREPRKVKNTTSEQLLDPARLDGLFAAVELPEQLHEPMRRIAEREARSYEPSASA